MFRNSKILFKEVVMKKKKHSLSDDMIYSLPLKLLVIKLKQENVKESHEIFGTNVVYIHLKEKETKARETFEHYIAVYFRGDMIFKFCFPNGKKDREFSGIKEALKIAGMEVTLS